MASRIKQSISLLKSYFDRSLRHVQQETISGDVPYNSIKLTDI